MGNDVKGLGRVLFVELDNFIFGFALNYENHKKKSIQPAILI
jgi:hypothetical protein